MDFFLGILFSAIGSGYVLYARRQANAPFAIAGVLLMIFPWFVSGIALTIVIGCALTAAPFAIERFYA